MSGDQRVTVVAVVDVPPEAVGPFQRYEDLVLPLLDRHRGRLERRLRSPDGRTEVHVLSFPTDGDYRRYVADPDRSAHRSLLSGVPVTQRVVEALTDV